MKKLVLVLLSGLITACAATDSHVNSTALETYVAEDVTAQISRDYPAANTTIAFNARDNFGSKLSQDLRAKGFAVSDNNASDSKKLSIVLDEVYKGLYRVTYTIDGYEVFARAYVIDMQSGVKTSGSWTKIGN